MAANTNPIYSRTAQIDWAAAVTAANTAKDGTGTTATVFTADATEGGFVHKLRGMPLGTNVASVARLFINNGQSAAVAANNVYYGDVSLPATTLTEVAGQLPIEIPLSIPLPPGYKLLVALGTAVAAGWQFSVVGGKY